MHTFRAAGHTLVLLMSAGMLRQAGAMMADLPMPALIQQSGLIVEATVQAVKEPVRQELRVADLNFSGRRPDGADVRVQKGIFNRTALRVTRIYRDQAGATREGDVIGVLSAAPPPAPAPGDGPRLVVMDGPFYPRLLDGTRYLLFLQPTADAHIYYLPSYFKCMSPVEQMADRIPPNELALLEVDRWNWGEASDGLQLAALVHQPTLINGGKTHLQVMIAARNVSAAPITLSAHAALKSLRLQVTKDSGAEVVPAPDLFANVRQPDARSIPLFTLQPGEMAFLSEAGPAAWWSFVPAALAPGAYTLRAIYAVDAAKLQPLYKEDPLAEQAWKDSAQSAACPFTVQAAR